MLRSSYKPRNGYDLCVEMDLSSSLTKTSLLYTSSDGKTHVYRGLFSHYPVVIKELHFTVPAEAASAMQEYHTQNQLRHENVCRVFGCSLSEDYLSLTIVLESMEIDLTKEVQNRKQYSYPWREEQLWGYFWQLIDALAYAQKEGICHRDIKPRNIFITFDKQMKIGDFGTAKFMQSSITTTLVGTPYYLSPELKYQFQSRRAESQEYNPFKSDVYSLGLTFLYMIQLGESVELTYLANLEGNTQIVIQNLLVSDPMKALLGEMLRVGDRYDFLGLQGYLVSLYQTKPEPPLDPYPAAPREEYITRQIYDTVKQEKPNLSALEWCLNNPDYQKEALAQIFMSANIQLSYSCTKQSQCFFCSQFFTVDISRCTTEDDYLYCSVECKSQYLAKPQELLSSQEPWIDYQPTGKEAISEESKGDIGRNSSVLSRPVVRKVQRDDCSPESKSSPNSCQEKEAGPMIPKTFLVASQQVPTAKQPVEIAPKQKGYEKSREDAKGGTKGAKNVSKSSAPKSWKPTASKKPKKADLSPAERQGMDLGLHINGKATGIPYQSKEAAKHPSKRTN